MPDKDTVESRCWWIQALYFCIGKGLHMICHSRCMRHKIVDFRHRAQCAAGRNTQLFKCAHGPDPLSMILRQSKTNKKTFFQELLCSSKKLEYCHYLQDP